MNLDTEDEFLPQESLLDSRFAPNPVSSIVLNDSTESIKNRENHEASLDLPLNSKESCTLDLELEVECDSEPLIARQTQSKSSLVSNPASLTDNSTLPDGATAVSPQQNDATLQPLHGIAPSTSASSNFAKNILGNRATDAAKMIPLRIKGDISAPTIMFSPDKLATLKKYRGKGVVCTVKLACQNAAETTEVQQNWINSPTSSPKRPRLISTPSLYLKAPTAAPISAAKSTITILKPNVIGLVPNQSMSLPIFTMNGLLPGSQHHTVTSLNNSSLNNLVFSTSPNNVTSTDTRVMNILPSSVALQKNPMGYQVFGSQVNTAVPVSTLLPVSNRIPTKTIDSILLSGSTVRTMSPTASANPAAIVAGVTWPAVTGSTIRASSEKPTYLIAHLNGLMNEKPSPTPVKPIAPNSVRALMNIKSKGKLPPISIQSKDVIVPMVQPDGNVLLKKKTVLYPEGPNDVPVNSNSFTLNEVSNNPSESGVAKKFVVYPTRSVPVSTAAQFTSSVSSSMNISNNVNNGSNLSSPGSTCGEHTIDKRFHSTSILWHQTYSGESPSSEVVPRVVDRLVSLHSQTQTDGTICLSSDEEDCVAHEILSERISYTNPMERAEDMKIPIPVSSSTIKGSFRHHHSTDSTNLGPKTERNIDTKEDPELSVETISCVEHTQDIKIPLSNSQSSIEGPFQWRHLSTVSSTQQNDNYESKNLREPHNDKNHEIIPSSVGTGSLETHAPPRHFKIVQNRQFSETFKNKKKYRGRSVNYPPSKKKNKLKVKKACFDNDSVPTTPSLKTSTLKKKRKNRARSVNYPPTKKQKKKNKLKVKKAGFDNVSVPTTPSQPFGLVTSTSHLMSSLTQKQMEDQLDGLEDCEGRLHETALQWHHPCTYPLECSVKAGSMVTEEPDVTPEPENPRGTHKMVSPPIASHSSMTINPSANIPQNISSSGQNEIAKYEDEDELKQKVEEIKTKERIKSPQTGNSDGVESPGACRSAPGTDAEEDSIAQIEPVSSEIKIAIQNIPGCSDVEPAVQHIPGDYSSEQPVVLSDDDDYHCAIPSPTEGNPGGSDDSYSAQPTAKSISIKNDIPTFDHGSIHSALQWRNSSNNTESTVKAETLSDSEFNQASSTSPSFMGNQDNAVDSEEKYTLRSELGIHVPRSEEDIHNIDLDTVSSTATESRALRNPASSTPDTMNGIQQTDGVPARPVYPNAVLKWNRDRIHKIQLNLKRRMKMREQGKTNLWPPLKRQMGGKDTRPKKSQNLNDNSNLTTDSKQCDDDDDRSSSSGCKMQKDSPIDEVISNVLQDCIIRKTIQDCYSKKLVPSIQMIHDACCNSGLDFSKETLQPYLKSIGFNWVSCHSGRLLVEDPRFTTKRIEYLDQLEAYSDKNLVYLFVSDLVARTAGWQTYPYNAKEYLDSRNIAPYVVMHAMSNTILIDGGLLVLKLYQDKVDTNRIGYWLKNIVLPKVPKGSVVILGDGIFELTVEAVERPHMGYSKVDIIYWLKSHNVSLVNPDLPKAMLLSKAYDVDVPKTSIFDQTIRQSGFEILYLPKHHKDLNPIEFLWQDILEKLIKSPEVKYGSCLEEFVEQEFFSCSQKMMSVASHLVKKFEATYRDFDFCFDELFDSMTSIVGPVGDETLKEPPAKTPKTSKPRSIPVTDLNLHTCPVCRNLAKLTGFRCFKCKFFWKNLIQKYKNGAGRALPVCKMYRHVSTRPPTCNGCRRNQYELALLKTYPNRALPLPPVTYKGEKHSRSIPFKTYPEISEDPSFQCDEEFEDSV